jgi:acetate kinase
MHILVVNSGSSSIKFSMFDSNSPESLSGPCLFDGEISGIGTPDARIELRAASEKSNLSSGQFKANAKTLVEAMQLVMNTVCARGMPAVHAVGYRVVHPGVKLREHVRITPQVLHDLEEAEAFAPLHDPAVIAVIRKGMQQFPDVGHYACFDTVFHQTMLEEASIYPVPQAYREKGVRRYGFHGLSCESIVRQMRANEIGCPKRMVIAHLGSGCSVTALMNGYSVDTTMGLTPTGGVVMGTRPGDLDPGAVLYLLRQQQGGKAGAISAVETMLNHESGMIALTGMANDVKAVRSAAAEGDARALLALKVFTRSVTKAIGAFCWLLGGLDAIVFAGGIGEHDALTRLETLAGLEDMGISINSSLNEQKAHGVARISASESKTEVFVIPSQEDLMIAVHVDRMAGSDK